MSKDEHYASMRTLLSEYLRHMRATGYSGVTILHRTRVLLRLHKHLSMGLAFGSKPEIEAFLEDLVLRGLKRSSIRNYLDQIRGFYGWADAMGKLDGDPTLLLRRPAAAKFRPKPLTAEQVELAMSSPEPLDLMMALAYYEGLRAAEIAACRREDFTEHTTYIPRAKGGDAATVPTHPVVWEMVRNRPPGRLFPVGPRGGVVNSAWVTWTARKQLHRLGVQGHIHQLRHTFATDQLVLGADIRTVQANLRHASLVTSAAYLEVTDPRRRAAIALLPVVGAPAGSKPAGAAHGRPPA